MIEYAWLVTKDNIIKPEDGLPTRKGWVGPRNAPDDLVALLKEGRGVQWRTACDDIHTDPDVGYSYYGRVIERDEDGEIIETINGMDADALAGPLDDLGTPDCGDAVIEHLDFYEGPEWKLIIG